MTTTNEPPVGLVGLGLLGSALARRLMLSSFTVLGHDVASDRYPALAAEGLVPASDLAAIAGACDRILLSLPSSKEVRTVIDELTPVLRSGTLLIDTTTGDPETIVPLAHRLQQIGVTYLDATISGSSVDTVRGEAIAMVGGPVEGVELAASILTALVRRWYHVGTWGSGTRMKLVTNLVLGLHRAALAEALGLAQAMDLGLDTTLAVLRDSAAYSRVMDTKGERMIRRDFSPQARLSQHLKDVRLILDEGHRTGAKLPLSELHRRLLEVVESAGWGHLDNSVIVRAFLNDEEPPL